METGAHTSHRHAPGCPATRYPFIGCICGARAAAVKPTPHWKHAEQLLADCEIGTNCNICRTLRGLLDERLSVRQQAVRETIESLGQKGWLEAQDVDALLATLATEGGI